MNQTTNQNLTNGEQDNESVEIEQEYDPVSEVL